MPESLAGKLSLFFIPIISAERHIMNIPFIVWSYEASISSLILQGWSVYYHTYDAVCVVTHNGMDPEAAIVTRP